MTFRVDYALVCKLEVLRNIGVKVIGVVIRALAWLSEI